MTLILALALTLHNPVRFLFEQYHPRSYYWEVVETVRRIMLTGMLVVFTSGSGFQKFFAIAICFFSTLLYSLTLPFIELSENWLALLTQANIFLTLITGVLFDLDKPNQTTHIVGGLLIASFTVTVLLGAFCGKLARTPSHPHTHIPAHARPPACPHAHARLQPYHQA